MSATINLCATLLRAACGLPDDAQLDITALPLADATRVFAVAVKNEHDQLMLENSVLREFYHAILREYDLPCGIPHCGNRACEAVGKVRTVL